jgi:hypothetical protein
MVCSVSSVIGVGRKQRGAVHVVEIVGDADHVVEWGKGASWQRRR